MTNNILASSSPLARTKKSEEQKICAVFPGIEPSELLELVGIISEALKQPTINENYIIHSRWLSEEFSPNRETKFYIEPEALKTIKPELLSLRQVLELIRSIPRELQQHRKAEISLLKSSEGNKLVQDYFKLFNLNILIADRILLQLEAHKLVDVMTAIVRDAPDEVEKIVEVGNTVLPEWLQATEKKPALVNYSEGVVPDVVEGFLETPSGASAVSVRGTAPSPIPLREYLNKWLQKLQQELPKEALPSVGLLEHSLFQATSFDVPTVTANYINSDLEVLKEWDDVLFPAIDTYLKQRVGGAGWSGAFTKKKEDKTDKEESELTQDDEAQESTLAKFDAAGVSYAETSARLSAELFPLFFSLHGLNNIEELSRGLTDDQLVQFKFIKKDFDDQIDFVLRHLTQAQIENLKNPDGRIKALQMLFKRLAGRREFTERIKFLAEKVTELKVEKENQGKALSADQKKQKIEIELGKISSNAGRIDEILKSQERQAEIAQAFEKATLNLTELGSITEKVSGATKGDFENLFNRVLGGTSLNTTLTIQALDSYVAERLSPERLRRLSPLQFSSIFGFDIPAQLLDTSGSPTPAYWRFMNLCAEYVHLRRTRLSDHFRVDAISHTKDLTSDLNSEQNFGLYTSEEIAELQEVRHRVSENHVRGASAVSAGEVVIGAKALNKQSVQNITNNPLAKQIQKEHKFVEEQRVIEQQSLGKTRKRALIQKIVDDSNFYYGVDGFVELEKPTTLATQNPIELVYSANIPSTLSPLNSKLQFRDISPPNKGLQAAKKSFLSNAFDIGETALATAAGPAGVVYKAIPKEAKAVAAAATIGLVLDTVNKFMNGGVFSKLLGATGGLIGGIGGSFILPGAGTAVGAFAGSLTGVNLGYNIDKSLGLLGKSLPIPSFGGLPGPLGGAPAAGLPTVAPLTQLAEGARNILSSAFTPAAALPWTVGLGIGIAYVNSMVLSSAFIPPKGGDTSNNAYVSMTKEAVNKNGGLGAQTYPATVGYTIRIGADKGYKITIHSIKDVLSVDGNKDRNPQPPAAPTSDITLDKLRGDPNYSKYFVGNDLVLNPGDSIDITYEKSFDQSFHDTGITNDLEIAFSAELEGKSVDDIAQASATICLDECPKPIDCLVFGEANQTINACGATANSQEWSEKNKSLVTQAFSSRAGQSKKFSDLLCSKGDLTAYKLPGSTYGGCAPSAAGGKYLIMYDLGLGSLPNTEYTLVHEMGHIIDYRNPNLRERFKKEAPWSGSYYTYPYDGNQFEAFAEGIVLTVIYKDHVFRTGKFDFAGLHPAEHAWFVTNIFGQDPSGGASDE